MAEERIAAKIEALFARARDEEGTTEAERDACLSKAEALMMKYNIDSAILDMDGSNKSGRVITRITLSRLDGEFCYDLEDLRLSLYQHARCATAYADGGRQVVGYEDDIRFGDLLWAKVQMDFTSRMRPVWSKSRSFEENVYLLKESGKSWMEVVYAENRALGVESKLTEKSGSKLRTAYRNWAKMIGQDSRQVDARGRVAHAQNPKKWREGFMMSYTETVGNRLWKMRMQAEADNPPGKEGEVALLHDADRVKAHLWDLFPDLHPDEVKRRSDEAWQKEEERRAKLTDKERRREDEKRERENRRWERSYKPRTIDPRGWQAGHSAAQKVDLSTDDRIGYNAKRLGA